MAEKHVQIPVRLLVLPAELLHLYAAIRSFDWMPKKGKERKGCTAAIETLAAMVGRADRQTRENLDRLEACGAVKVTCRRPLPSLVICTPENFDPGKLNRQPAADSTGSPPPVNRRSTAGSSGGPPPVNRQPAADSTGSPSPVNRQSTADEVDPVSRSRQADEGSRNVALGSSTASAPGPLAVLVLTSPEPPQDKAQKAPRKPAKALKEPAPSSAVWDAYAAAYEARYRTAPVRNAKVNTALAGLVARLGIEEAPAVAAFYVSHSDAFYVRTGHSVGVLLKDAEKLRTEWATGQRINAHTARQMEQTAANPAWAYAQELEAKERQREQEQRDE